MNLCMGGVWPAWPGGRDMGGWPSCLLDKLLVEGIIFRLAFYYIGYTLSGQIIMHSEIIIIWPLSVYEDQIILEKRSFSYIVFCFNTFDKV